MEKDTPWEGRGTLMRVIKIGGGASLDIGAIADDIAELKEKVVVVHGANYYRDQLLNVLGIQKEILTSVKGFSSVNSTPEILDSMMMTYSGLRNKRIVEIFQQKGINAIGLTGIDGGLIRGIRNKGIRVIENGKKKLKRDLSGKAKSINIDLLNLLLHNGYTPILTMPILDENSFAINSENDDVVSLIVKNLQPTLIHMLIEEKGYLNNNNGKKIDLIKLDKLEDLILSQGGRMKRKLNAIKQMLFYCDTTIIISDGRIKNPIFNAQQGTVFEI
ncbi:MAG: Acetylglutamate/acetylaminoadipate kinase [Candidatus Heimdallarchaeota archaeon LC_2]|nr:MAG: Acetylglutamate/acetylaminoadipate kinase [Candidatus Heimdallarchaeota archaeon LC_2]